MNWWPLAHAIESPHPLLFLLCKYSGANVMMETYNRVNVPIIIRPRCIFQCNWVFQLCNNHYNAPSYTSTRWPVTNSSLSRAPPNGTLYQINSRHTPYLPAQYHPPVSIYCLPSSEDKVSPQDSHPLPYSSLLMNTNDTSSPFPPASPSSSFIFFNLNLKHMSSYHKQHFVALLKYIIHKDLIDIYQ